MDSLFSRRLPSSLMSDETHWVIRMAVVSTPCRLRHSWKYDQLICVSYPVVGGVRMGDPSYGPELIIVSAMEV
jgi:hypothetical protein